MGTDIAGMGWDGMGFGMVLMVGFWVLAIVGAVAVMTLLVPVAGRAIAKNHPATGRCSFSRNDTRG